MYTIKNNIDNIFIGFRGVARILPCRKFGLRPDSPSFSPPKVGGLDKKYSFLCKQNNGVGVLQQTKGVK